MCERRGYAMLITGGDPEISGAITEGMQAARGGDLIRPASRATFPIGGRLLEDREPVNWREVAKLVKVAVGNTKGAEDYAILRAAAEQEYRMPDLSELARVRERLLAIYALTFYRLRELFDWEGTKWHGN